MTHIQNRCRRKTYCDTFHLLWPECLLPSLNVGASPSRVKAVLISCELTLDCVNSGVSLLLTVFAVVFVCGVLARKFIRGTDHVRE